MDWSALAIAAAWASLAGVFGFGWLRCGNGHWRWAWLRRLAHWQEGDPIPDPSPNAPLFGLIALGCLLSTVRFAYLTAGTAALTQGRFLNRMLGELPWILLFVAVAVIRKPWGGGG